MPSSWSDACYSHRDVKPPTISRKRLAGPVTIPNTGSQDTAAALAAHRLRRDYSGIAAASAGREATELTIRCKEVSVTTSSVRACRQQESAALMLLAEYLDLPLRSGGSLIMMQQCDDLCGMYIGNASGGQEDLTFYGTISASVAALIRGLTKAGRNRIEVAGRQYYFFRSLTHFEDRGAVMFAPA